MELEHGRTTGIEPRDSLMGLIILEREVAGVVRDAKRAVDEALRWFFSAELFEKTDGFGCVLGVADRLGLQREAQRDAGAVTQAVEMFAAREQVAAHDLELIGGAAETLEGTRQRADGADLIRRTKRSEEVEESIGIFEARGLAPVRREDVILYGLTVKRAKRKAIDTRDDAVLLIQPMAEGRQRRWLGELRRSTVAKAQSEDVRLTWRDAVTHAEGVVAQTREGLHPPFAAMDVGTIGEAEAGRELHVQRRACGSLKFGDCDRKRTGLP